MTLTLNDKTSQASLLIYTTPPSQPGWHWWKSDPQSREIMVQVRLIDGQLKMRLDFRDDVLVAEAKERVLAGSHPAVYWTRQPDCFVTLNTTVPHLRPSDAVRVPTSRGSPMYRLFTQLEALP